MIRRLARYRQSAIPAFLACAVAACASDAAGPTAPTEPIDERLSETILFMGTIADPTVRTSEDDGQPPTTCRSEATAR